MQISFLNQFKDAKQKNTIYIYIKYTAISLRIIQILQEAGQIFKWKILVKSSGSKSIRIFFKNKKNVINFHEKFFFSILKVSSNKKPCFFQARDLWLLNKGLHFYILTTSRGLLTDRQARQFKVGGEILCFIKN